MLDYVFRSFSTGFLNSLPLFSICRFAHVNSFQVEIARWSILSRSSETTFFIALRTGMLVMSSSSFRPVGAQQVGFCTPVCYTINPFLLRQICHPARFSFSCMKWWMTHMPRSYSQIFGRRTSLCWSILSLISDTWLVVDETSCLPSNGRNN